MSKSTRDLCDQKEREVEHTDKQCEELKQKRKQTGLKDFKKWVQEYADRLNHTSGQGDIKEVYNLINQMEGKPTRNLIADAQGNMLKNTSEVTSRWFSFLWKTFSVTVVEQGRSEMSELPKVTQGNTLSEEEVLRAISKLISGKVCGLDGIPVEVYKHVPVCKDTNTIFSQISKRTNEISQDT